MFYTISYAGCSSKLVHNNLATLFKISIFMVYELGYNGLLIGLRFKSLTKNMVVVAPFLSSVLHDRIMTCI